MPACRPCSPASRVMAIAALACLLGSAPSAADDVPPRSESGQTLMVPEKHLDLGDVYHVSPGEDAQLICLSDAPLQRLAVVNRRIVGYVVVPFDRTDKDPPIVAGALRIPAATFDTGLSAIDDVLRADPLLDAVGHPEITCVLTGVKSFEREGDAAPARFKMRIAGTITIKGKTIEKEFDAAITYRPFTWQTMGRYPGELLTLRATLDLTLNELGLEKPGPPWAERLADSLRCEAFLLCNTVPPDKTLDPAAPQKELTQRLRIVTFLRDLDRPRDAYDAARAYLKDYGAQAGALNRLAMDLVTSDGLRSRGLDLALEAAQAAVRLTEKKDAAILDTLAQVHFARGNVADAVALLTLALQQSDKLPPPLAQELRNRLKRYEACQAADGAAPRTER